MLAGEVYCTRFVWFRVPCLGFSVPRVATRHGIYAQMSFRHLKHPRAIVAGVLRCAGERHCNSSMLRWAARRESGCRDVAGIMSAWGQRDSQKRL